jgi:hypothetical protein
VYSFEFDRYLSAIILESYFSDDPASIVIEDARATP